MTLAKLARGGERRRRKRKKKDLTAKGWQLKVPGMGEPLQGARGHPYLFECVVARDKNDAGESTESMCHGATTTENLFHPHRHLAEIVEEKRKI